jgi:hypothetical protein
VLGGNWRIIAEASSQAASRQRDIKRAHQFHFAVDNPHFQSNAVASLHAEFRARMAHVPVAPEFVAPAPSAGSNSVPQTTLRLSIGGN